MNFSSINVSTSACTHSIETNEGRREKGYRCSITVTVPYSIEGAVEEQAHRFQDNQLFHSWFYNEDGSLKTAGDIIKRPLFSNMLRTIAENGIDEFYNGSIAQEIVEEVSGCG